MYGIAFGAYLLLFNTSHQIFAWQYHVLSTDIPRLMRGEEKTDTVERRQTLIKTTLMALNIILPCALPYFYIQYGDAIFLNSFSTTCTIVNGLPDCCNPTKYQEYSYDFVFDAIGVLQLISGYLLVDGVLKVRRFFVKNDSQDSIDTKILAIHSTSYVLYMAANVLYYSAFTFHVFKEPDNPKAFNEALDIFYVSGCLMFFFSFVSQCLIAKIFWDLGNPDDSEEDTNHETFSEL